MNVKLACVVSTLININQLTNFHIYWLLMYETVLTHDADQDKLFWLFYPM